MARITDSLLVQRVDSQIVLVDESAGEEVTFPVDVVPNVIAAMSYLSEDHPPISEDVAGPQP